METKKKRRTLTPEEKEAQAKLHEKDNIGCLFMDSGGHSLYTKFVMSKFESSKRSERNKRTVRDYSQYETDEFWAYVDSYANWVKENIEFIEYYVNIDAIFNPVLTWKIQKYLEDAHGLEPVPVIHSGTPLKWVRRYMNAGYDFIGLGGLGQDVHKDAYYAWADSVFGLICDNPKRLPVVRTHGFAMTSWSLLSRYPWWSVDSASWVKAAGFGHIYVPRKKKGKFDFTVPPFAIAVSKDSAKLKKKGRHVAKMRGCDKSHVVEWVNSLGVEYGESTPDGEVIVEGVENSHLSRSVVNIKFFKMFADSLPEWPWPFRLSGFSGFREL